MNTSMGRTRRDCPICNKKGLLRLPNHLRSVHNLDPQDVMASRAQPASDDASIDDDDLISDSGEIFDDDDDDDDDQDDDDDGLISDDGSDMEDEENEETEDVWCKYFVEHIFDKFQEDMDARVAELQADDMSNPEAQKITFEEFLPEMNTDLKKRIMKFFRVNHALKKDHIFQKILATAQTGRHQDDMDWEESMVYALTKRSFLLNKILRSWTFPFGENEDSD